MIDCQVFLGYNYCAMRVVASIVVLFLLPANLFAQPNKSPTKDKNNSPNQTAGTSASNDEGKTSNNTDQSDCGIQRIGTALKRPEWWVVIVAALTGLTIAYQAREMSRATNVMRGQLIVMQGQLTETENTKRPWLFLVPDERSYRGQPTQIIHWKIANRGKTTAQLSRVLVECKVLRGMGKILKNPARYTEKIESDFSGVPIAPNGEIAGSSWVEGENGRADGLTAKDVQDIQSAVADLVVLGRIFYRNQAQRMEARFCYHYAPKLQDFRINLLAESEYHQCT